MKLGTGRKKKENFQSFDQVSLSVSKFCEKLRIKGKGGGITGAMNYFSSLQNPITKSLTNSYRSRLTRGRIWIGRGKIRAGQLNVYRASSDRLG